MKKDITSRVIRQRRETKRVFRTIVDKYEDLGIDKTVEQIADDCFELGVYTLIKTLRNGKKD